MAQILVFYAVGYIQNSPRRKADDLTYIHTPPSSKENGVKLGETSNQKTPLSV